MDSLDKVLVSNFIVFIVYKQPICHAYYVFAFLLYFRISIKLIKYVIYIVKTFSYYIYTPVTVERKQIPWLDYISISTKIASFEHGPLHPKSWF